MIEMEIEIKATTGPITIPAMAPPDNQLLDVTLLYNPNHLFLDLILHLHLLTILLFEHY
jgi:hypothetical protein